MNHCRNNKDKKFRNKQINNCKNSNSSNRRYNKHNNCKNKLNKRLSKFMNN